MTDKITQIAQNVAEKAMGMLNDASLDSPQMGNKPSRTDYEKVSLAQQQENNIQNILITKKQNIMARIIEKVTLNDVRECLDELGFNSKYYREDGIIVTWYSADEDFRHDVALMFRIEGENNDWLKMQAMAQSLYIPTNDAGDELIKAYINVNRYNNYRRYGKAYVDRDTDEDRFFYVFEENLVADKPLTYELLKGNIEIFCPSAWLFFKDHTQTTKGEKL